MKMATLASEGLYPPIRKVDRASKNLALAILYQAFRDVVSPNRAAREWELWRRDAGKWFSAVEKHPGSFRWVCDILEMDSTELLRWIDSYKESGTGQQRDLARKLIRFRFHGN